MKGERGSLNSFRVMMLVGLTVSRRNVSVAAVRRQVKRR
jgi:RNase P protein component